MSAEFTQRGRPKKVAPVAALVELPRPPFLYTLDQVAMLVSWSVPKVHSRTFYIGRTLGPKSRDMLQAFNLAALTQKPDWRVSEQEFVRWLRVHGYKPVLPKLEIPKK